MVQKQICYGSVCDNLPPLYANYPWMVDRTLDGTGEQPTFNTIPDKDHLPDPPGRHIRGYFHGWVILFNNTKWSLWNPVTCNIIHLPRLTLKDGDSIGHCCLSAPPDDPNSVLLLTIHARPTFVYCLLDSRRKGFKWIYRYYGRQLSLITGYDGFLHDLTLFKGKIYAVSSGLHFIIQIVIVVKYGEVGMELLLCGSCPFPSYNRLPGFICFLKGSCTELFYIIVAFNERTSKRTLNNVYLYKWVMTSTRMEEMKEKDLKDLETNLMWEEIKDLKNSIFFVDLTSDHLVFYKDSIASEFGGYVHVRGEMIHSYHVQDKTISLSSLPSPTSHMWACRLKSDHGKSKCTLDYKDDMIGLRSVMDDEIELNESHLLNIPFDILEMIMKLCVGVEYMNFRVTCKRCHLAAPLRQWSNTHALRRLNKYSVVSPWLMVVDKNRGIISLTDPMFGDKYFMKKPQVSISHDRTYCCRFGWLLFNSNILSSLAFFNPFTNDIHKLPPSFTYFDNLCFSAPPTAPDCMVIGFNYKNGDPHVYVHFVAREQSWRMLRLNFGGAGPDSFRCPTFYSQDLYALSNDGGLYVIKNLVKERDYSWKKVVAAKGTCVGKKFLTKCDQHLLLVTVGDFLEYVEVFKLEDHTKEWERIQCLGKYMIYISDTTCLCIEAKTREMENKIYFPRLHSNNGRIVIYSLETCRYHTFNGKNIEDNYGVGIEHVHPHVWIEPSWS